MSDDEAASEYELVRSHSDNRLFVICYADRFYTDVPKQLISRGPWRSGRGPVTELKPDIRLALARDGYFVIETDAPYFNPKA